MSTRTPTNRTLKIVSRKGETKQTGLAALVLPARPEVIAIRDMAAGYAYEVHFKNLVTGIEPTDRLVNETDETEEYRVVGIAMFDTPHASHTEVVAEAKMGT